MGETQEWSINEQLNNGIRFLDIRLSNSSTPDDFEVRHGIIQLGSFNEKVMKSVNTFLEKNPTEVVFMSIKDEGPLETNRLERDYINAPDSKFYQSPVNGSTELEKVRGKIVLFNRYNYNTAVGMVWGSLNIQDDYNLDTECKEIPILFWSKRTCGPHVGLDYPKKAASVLAHFNQAANAYNNAEFWVNFTSAHYNGIYIGNNAEAVNARTLDYIQTSRKPIGSIIVMDYPDRTPGLIKSIISHSLRNHGTGRHLEMTPWGNTGVSDSDGFWGTWGKAAMCADGHYVTGYSMKYEANQGGGDDTAVNGFAMFCSDGSMIKTKEGKWGGWTPDNTFCRNNDPMTGFRMWVEKPKGNGDDTAVDHMQIACGMGVPEPPYMVSTRYDLDLVTWAGGNTVDQFCSYGLKVVGFITRVEDDQGGNDDTALNGLRVFCAKN